MAVTGCALAMAVPYPHQPPRSGSSRRRTARAHACHSRNAQLVWCRVAAVQASLMPRQGVRPTDLPLCSVLGTTLSALPRVLAGAGGDAVLAIDGRSAGGRNERRTALDPDAIASTIESKRMGDGVKRVGDGVKRVGEGGLRNSTTRSRDTARMNNGAGPIKCCGCEGCVPARAAIILPGVPGRHGGSPTRRTRQ